MLSTVLPIVIYSANQYVVYIYCRYLALVAAMASEADFVFIPENPVASGWQEQLCGKLKQVGWQHTKTPKFILTHSSLIFL